MIPRKGYMQTEVGVIPEDWDIDILETFWTVTDCKHITAEFVENGFPLASIKEVQSLYVDFTTAMETTEAFYLKLIEGGRKPIVGDLIFSRNATVGEVAQVAEWHPPFAMGQDVCLLRKRKAKYSSVYLQTVIQSQVVRDQLDNLMVGSTFKRVNIEQIRNFLIPFPSPEEQTLIATVLSDVDSLINSLEKLIKKKWVIKQGAMQELLKPKEGWVVNRVEELFSLYSGKSKTQFLTESGDFVVMDMGSVSAEGKIIKSKFTNVIFPFLNIGDLVMPKDDIGGGNIIGKVAYIDFDNIYVLGDHVFRLRKIRNSVDSLFFHYLINSIFIRNELRQKATGSAQLSISRGTVLNQELAYPENYDEQYAISKILSDMDTEICSLEQNLAKYKMLKQGMMQELLTGKTRLI